MLSNENLLPAPQVGDVWHRYKEVQYGSVDEWGQVVSTRVELLVSHFQVMKVTPKGVWLVWVGTPEPREHIEQLKGSPRDHNARFVLLAAHKQYASPTQELALDGFIARKKRQAKIYESRLKTARTAQAQAESMKEGLQRADKQRAWELYCQETAGGADVRDFWEELSPKVQSLYLQKVRAPQALAA